MLKIADWVSFEEAESGEYITDVTRIRDEHIEVLEKAVVSENIRVGGDSHQERYVPVFSDGTTLSFSYREWGAFMAAIWGEHEGVEYKYMDFYMDVYIPEIKK